MSVIKSVGQNGQISLGKEFAGKLVLVEQIEPGVFMLKLGDFVPDSERWLLESENQSDLDEALEWAKNTPASSTDLDSLERRMDNE